MILCVCSLLQKALLDFVIDKRYKNKIAANLSKLLECDVNCINEKAKTADGIGLIGQSKAIACWITTKLIEI